MALCCRQLAAQGLIAGRDGNLSVRLDPSRVLVTPSGFIKSQSTATDMVEIDLATGQRTRGARGSRKPTSELDLHLQILRHRPDVRAVVHAHPPTATAFAVAGESLEHAARIIAAARAIGEPKPLSAQAVETLDALRAQVQREKDA